MRSHLKRRDSAHGRSQKFKKFFRPGVFFCIGLVLGATFGIYLWSLYRQLNDAFGFREQYVPTRIYSDLHRIRTGVPRPEIEERLRALAYTVTHDGANLNFQLHSADYPDYLLPPGHPQRDSREANITLSFGSGAPNSLLQSIQLGHQTVYDIYLEPELIATLSRNDQSKKEIRTFLKFEEIPALVWKAIIAIEDQHFLEHKGLDPRGIARAIWINFKTLSFAQGGSTITQQLVKNLMARRSKNVFQKVNEIFLAFLLEAKFSKEEILERYLNEVYLGQIGSLEIHGVAEGAQHFFGKRLQDLNLSETALMAGLIRGPGFYSPYRHKDRAMERQHLVISKMVETGQIAPQEAKAALKHPIRLAPPQTSSVKAPFFVDFVKSELLQILKNKLTEPELIRSGFRVFTTLDLNLNQLAQKSVTEGVALLEKRLKIPPTLRIEGALACVEPHTGKIRALIGGRSYAQSNFNRILNMKRQVGSTFKPFVYLAALLKGTDSKEVPYGPGYPLEDTPWTLTYDHGNQTWSPKNIDHQHRGWISLKTSLAQSVNITTARLANEVGIERIQTVAHQLGIESKLPSVPSLSLGVAELSPIELLQAYATLANQGIREEMQVILGITQTDGTNYLQLSPSARPTVEPVAIDLLTELLEEVFKSGSARSAQNLGFIRPAAGKTGTTSNYRDAWFAGYTPQLATVTWVGADQSSLNPIPSFKLTGSNSALPIWADFMKKALQNEPALPLPENPLLVKVPIDLHTGQEASLECPQTQVSIEKYIPAYLPHLQTCEPHWPPSVKQTTQD